MWKIVVAVAVAGGCYRDARPSASEVARQREIEARERRVASREREIDNRERALVRFRAIEGAPDAAVSDVPAMPPAAATHSPSPQHSLPVTDDEVVRCVSPHANELIFIVYLQWGRIYRLAEHEGTPPYHQISNGPLDVTKVDAEHRILEASGNSGFGGKWKLDIHGDQVSIDVFSTDKKQVPPYTDHLCVFQKKSVP